MAKKPISQSDTRWVKKEGKRGYVEQISTGKRVTGKVKLSADTTKGKAGETQRYKAGVGKKASPNAAGGGTTGGKPKSPSAGSSSTSRSNPAGPPAPPPAKKTAAQRQNKNVKVGTIKVGAKGKQANRWNGKRWVPVAGSKTGYATSANGGVTSKPTPSKSATPSNYTGFSVNKPGGGSPPKGKTGQVYINGRWVAGNSSTAKAAAAAPKKVTSWSSKKK